MNRSLSSLPLPSYSSNRNGEATPLTLVLLKVVGACSLDGGGGSFTAVDLCRSSPRTALEGEAPAAAIHQASSSKLAAAVGGDLDSNGKELQQARGKPVRRWRDREPSIFFRERERLGAREEEGSFGSWRALISGGIVIDGNGDRATSPVRRRQDDGDHLSPAWACSDGIILLSPTFFTQQHEQSSDGGGRSPASSFPQ
nr:hypothetical protein Iba_chr02cCG8710 [Ipomoea batatas]